MGEPVDRVADDLHVGHRGQPGAQPVHERTQPGVLGRGLRNRGLQAHRCRQHLRQADPAGDPPALVLVRGKRGAPADAGTHGEHPDARRAAPLAGARRQQRPARRDRDPAHALRGVDQQRHVAEPLGDGLDRLDGADLVAGTDEATQRRARAGCEAVDVDPPEPVDRDHRAGGAASAEAACAAAARTAVAGGAPDSGQDAGVLHGGVQHVPGL